MLIAVMFYTKKKKFGRYFSHEFPYQKFGAAE